LRHRSEPAARDQCQDRSGKAEISAAARFFSGRLLTKPDREQNKNYIEAGAPEQRSVDECERDVLPENDLQLQVSGA